MLCVNKIISLYLLGSWIRVCSFGRFSPNIFIASHYHFTIVQISIDCDLDAPFNYIIISLHAMFIWSLSCYWRIFTHYKVLIYACEFKWSQCVACRTQPLCPTNYDEWERRYYIAGEKKIRKKSNYSLWVWFKMPLLCTRSRKFSSENLKLKKTVSYTRASVINIIVIWILHNIRCCSQCNCIAWNVFNFWVKMCATNVIT